MDEKQSMKQYIENFVSNSLTDEEIEEDYGVSKNKVSALREYVVEQLMEGLNQMLENEIDWMKREDNLFEKFQDEEEE